MSVDPATMDHTNLRCYHATSAHALTAFTAQIWAPEPEHTTALSWLSGPEELRLCTLDLARCLAARTQGHRTSSVIPRKTADINPMPHTVYHPFSGSVTRLVATQGHPGRSNYILWSILESRAIQTTLSLLVPQINPRFQVRRRAVYLVTMTARASVLVLRG
ncbi:hypothetical protein K466DRAFT_208162 [Polyporus arcularius HHB13444]|uniref:Uncharacterized protein n=1 Tax=Polyporus arcularius HHB13444 TaxID=1314778 RepID=A0A5C3P5H4_9APHY|nr:hypothetical protein K466DRAFT_208162 [Polyporus arcularius HHB13444]